MAYTLWGGENGRAGAPLGGRTVICVHGLARNGRDFDALAGRLEARGARIACPDMVGRGRSDWLPSPDLYSYGQYLADLNALIARLDVNEVDWVGTSMGGLIGLLMAAQPGSPIRRLVLNDIGPFVPVEALQRIAGYVGADPGFTDRQGVETYLRQVNAGFGPMTDADWHALGEHAARPLPTGGWGLAYDPAIGTGFRAVAGQAVDLWPVYDRITCPVLVVRGQNSDVLPIDVATDMTSRGPRARLVEVPGAGHAPSLMDAPTIEQVLDFLGLKS